MGALLNIQMQIVYTFSHHLNIYTVYRYLHSLHSLNRYLHSLKYIPNTLYRATESTDSTSFILFNQIQKRQTHAQQLDCTWHQVKKQGECSSILTSMYMGFKHGFCTLKLFATIFIE